MVERRVDPAARGWRRLLQVFLNLLNNAIKYTPAGGTAWVTATADQTHFICNVKDNGQGIGAELLPRIFEVFTQARDTSAARGAVELRSEGPGRMGRSRNRCQRRMGVRRVGS